MNEEKAQKVCLACDRDSQTVPLISLEYQGRTFCICPQHLPVLIHDPTRLTGRLPGAETMVPSEHQD